MYNGAIIGFGKIARTNHIEAYGSGAISKKAKIVAAVEPNLANMEQSSQEFKDIRFYKSFEEMYGSEKIDFVDITTPPQHHYNILEKSISKELHIICEKPFTLNSQKALQVKNHLLSSDSVFIPCHQYKYSPIWSAFKKFIEKDLRNEKFLLQFNVFRTEADPGLKLLKERWRTASANQGGGIVADTGVHYLYLASWMLGKVCSVTARLSSMRSRSYSGEDTAFILLEGERGTAQIALTWGAGQRYNDAKIISGKGSMFYESGKNIIKCKPAKTEEIEVPDVSEKSHYTSLYVHLLNDFFKAVKKKEVNREWIEEAYLSVCLMEKCYLSSATGTTIGLGNEK